MFDLISVAMALGLQEEMSELQTNGKNSNLTGMGPSETEPSSCFATTVAEAINSAFVSGEQTAASLAGALLVPEMTSIYEAVLPEASLVPSSGGPRKAKTM